MKRVRFFAIAASLVLGSGQWLPVKAETTPLAVPHAAVSLHDAPDGARLFAPPVVEAGKDAWVSVYDQAGTPLAGTSVLVNDIAIATDSLGQASFCVPQSQRVTVRLSSTQKSASTQVTYTSTPGHWLVSQAYAADAVDRVEETGIPTETSPLIAYAPAAVETDQPFVLIGKNMSGKADADHVVLDGYDADVFAGSTASLLAIAPKRLSVGALRELYVTARGENSNTLEVDVCRLDVTINQQSQQSDEHGQIACVRVIGTNVPSLIELHNLSPNVVAFQLGARKLGAHSSIVTPGGESNVVSLGLTRLAAGTFDLDTHLVADAPWSAEDAGIFGDNNMRKLISELNRAEIIRLKRRLVALEARITEEQDNRTKALAAGTMDAASMDKWNAQLRSLSNRSRRINGSLVSRRAIFQSLGGTDADYRQAIEEATGNTAIALEKILQPITSVSLLATTSAQVGRSLHDGTQQDSSSPVASATEKDLRASIEALSRLRKRYPTKVAHEARLAPPPEPYIPDVRQITKASGFGLSQLINMNNLPPPPMILKTSLKGHDVSSTHSTSHRKNRKHNRHH